MAEEQFTPSPTEVTQATKIRASNMNQVLEGIRDLATKKISDFPTSTPTSSDYMLFEHENEEKNTTIKDAVNTCSLTYEEIMASTDLSGKVASASSVQTLGNNRDSWKPLTSIVAKTIVQDFENKFKSGANENILTLDTMADSEGGCIIFKHTTSKISYGIFFSALVKAKIVKRDTDATWYYRDIL